MKTIHEALSYVQKHLKVPKKHFNKFGNYHYRKCEDILEELKAIMPDGASVTINDDIICVGERHYICATARFHFGSDVLECKGLAREAISQKGMSDPQLTGSCSSYARKYALNGLFAIDDSIDDDSGKVAHEPAPPPPKPDVAPIVASILQCHQKDDWEFAKTILDDLDAGQKKSVWSALGGPVRIWIQSKTGAK